MAQLLLSLQLQTTGKRRFHVTDNVLSEVLSFSLKKIDNVRRKKA